MSTPMQRPKNHLPAEDALQSLIYLQAAERVLGPDMSQGDHGILFMQDIPFLAPSSMLVAHAVEICLNAYLSAFGVKTGKWKTNHDLVARLEAAESAGFAAEPSFMKYVRAINAAYKSGQFRYARAGQEPFISARGAIDLVRPTLERIHSVVAEKVHGVPTLPPDLPAAW